MLPYAEFGNIKTVDWREIDSFRTIRALIERYAEEENARQTPLSIAVFGAPGSGKAFAVRQIMQDIDVSSSDRKALEFNLAQFKAEQAEHLTEAFHQIQDRALS
jgi:hypothetical protein